MRIRKLLPTAIAVPMSLFTVLADADPADAVINLKVSVKWVRSSDNTVGPGDVTTTEGPGGIIPCDETATEQDFLDRIDYANRILDRSGRGYRFVVEFATVSPPQVAPGGNCGDKGTPGQANTCLGPSSCPTISPPAVVINEFMADPDLTYDDDGEWFELHNTTASPIDIGGWTVEDGGSNSFVIAGSLVIPAGGYALLGRRDDYYANGNLDLDYEYGDAFRLTNTIADAIILRNGGGTLVDRVDYDTTWTIPKGASLCLKSPTRDNSCRDAWTQSLTSYWQEWTSLGSHCRDNVIAASEADTVTWKWDPDALNVYMFSRCSGGASGTSRFGHQTAVIGQNEAGGFLRPFHELGHSLGICHTHGCGFPWNPKPCFCATPGSVTADDCLLDTPIDNAGWDSGSSPPGELADSVAMAGFSVLYDNLVDCADRQRVLDVVYNVMSYHRDNDVGFPKDDPPLVCDIVDIEDIDCLVDAASLPDLCRHRLSPDQMDRISDFSNTLLRRARDLGVSGRFAGGLTHFVDATGGACPVWCDSDDSVWECVQGNSIVPFTTLQGALDAVLLEHEPGMEHIIMLRPGSYNEPMTITERVDLRGTRGTVVIGK